MKASSRLGTARIIGLAAILASNAAFAANPLPPNPCTLITVPEVEQIIGKIFKQGQAGA